MNKQRFRCAWRPLSISAAAVLSAFSLSAETVRYEGFDSPAGPLHDSAGDTSFGWAEGIPIQPIGWVSEDVDGTYHGIVETGLSWPGLPTVDGSVELYHEGNGGGKPSRAFPTGVSYSAHSSGHLWFSVLVRPEITGDPSAGWGHVLVTLDQPGNPNNAVWMGIRWPDQTVWSGGGERMYLETTGEKYAASEVPVVSGETAFLVMHFDFGAQQVRFYVNPDATADDPGEPVGVYQLLEDFYASSVNLWLSNFGDSFVNDDGEPEPAEGADYNGTLVDEIRLGESWADVSSGAQIPDGGDDGDNGDNGDNGDDEPPVEEGEPIDDALVFFELDADTDEDFWLDTAGLGWVYAEDYPWVYSYSELGWLYNFETFATFTDGSWFWDHNRTNWVFTSSGDYPWLWIHTEGWVDASPSGEE